MKSSQSSEDYLKTILILSKRLPVVRSVDIANELGYKKSSISIAMSKLLDRGYITITYSGFISLTEEGKSLAEKINERHTLFTDFLVSLGVAHDIAEKDACRLEHAISDESFVAFKRFWLNQ